MIESILLLIGVVVVFLIATEMYGE